MTGIDLGAIGAIGRDLSAIIVFLLLVAGVLALFYVGFKKLMADKVASASAALSFGFLLVVMLTISEFKHVKGFGLDAETWDQKQIEAAKLVDQLKGLTSATSRELALLASKIGLWDNGPSNQDFMSLIRTLNPVLEASGFDSDQRNNLLKPIYERIGFNYTVDAYMDLYQAFQAEYKIVESSPCHSASELPPEAAAFREKLCQLTKQIYMGGKPDVSLVISNVEGGPIVDKQKLLDRLLERKADADFFDKNHILRGQGSQMY
jgi:hypothetical protein